MRTLIRSATVVDGSEQPGYPADVVLGGGTIEAIEPPGKQPLRGADLVVDGDGLVLCPGFIDMHSHADLEILRDPAHLSRVSQGITTEVLGQDGLSYAPVTDESLAVVRQRIAGWNSDGSDVDFSWRDVAGYLDRLDQGVAVNAAYLVPHAMLRAAVVGWDDVVCDDEEIEQMRTLLARSLREGAVGMSAGLTYAPGSYADRRELVELCEQVAASGGYFAPHHRSYGHGSLDAYAEMLEIAAAAGCPLHLTHATLNFPDNRGRAGELFALLDTALAADRDVTLDSYPYLAGATTLAALLPGWASAGSVEEILQRLGDKAFLHRVRVALEEEGSDGCHGVPVDWATIEVSSVGSEHLERVVGRTLAELAMGEGRTPFEQFCLLLQEDRLATGILQHVGDEANLRAVMRHSRHMAGSDGLLVGTRPHPRGWGTFPRYLGHYCRDLGLFSLEECVGHLTGRAARRLGLRGRGLVRTGFAADLVLLDPATVADRATYGEPRLPAAGIEWVFVNGQASLREGQRTGALAGRALRRTDRGDVA